MTLDVGGKFKFIIHILALSSSSSFFLRYLKYRSPGNGKLARVRRTAEDYGSPMGGSRLVAGVTSAPVLWISHFRAFISRLSKNFIAYTETRNTPSKANLKRVPSKIEETGTTI